MHGEILARTEERSSLFHCYDFVICETQKFGIQNLMESAIRYPPRSAKTKAVWDYASIKIETSTSLPPPWANLGHLTTLFSKNGLNWIAYEVECRSIGSHLVVNPTWKTKKVKCMFLWRRLLINERWSLEINCGAVYRWGCVTTENEKDFIRIKLPP